MKESTRVYLDRGIEIIADKIKSIADANRALAARVALLEGSQPAQGQKRLTFAIDNHITKDGSRTIRGIASTGSVDRVGDVVNPLGATWRLPLPLLRGHDHGRPIGKLDHVHLSARGIEVTATVATGIPDADESWELIRQKALQSFSIGFRAIESHPLPNGGTRFDKFELLELSVVSVPANADAIIEVAA